MNYFWCKKFFQIFISFFIGIFFFRNILVTCKLHNTRCALRHFGLQSFILQDLSACYSHRLLSLVPDKLAPPGSESRCFLSPRDSRLNLILSVLQWRYGEKPSVLGWHGVWSLHSSPHFIRSRILNHIKAFQTSEVGGWTWVEEMFHMSERKTMTKVVLFSIYPRL